MDSWENRSGNFMSSGNEDVMVGSSKIVVASFGWL